jgi:hypothetical protein
LSLITTIRQKKQSFGTGNQFLPSSRQERSGSGEIDFLNCWGKGKGERGKGEGEREKESGQGDGESGRWGLGNWKETGALQFCISNCLPSATLHLPFGEVKL